MCAVWQVQCGRTCGVDAGDACDQRVIAGLAADACDELDALGRAQRTAAAELARECARRNMPERVVLRDAREPRAREQPHRRAFITDPRVQSPERGGKLCRAELRLVCTRAAQLAHACTGAPQPDAGDQEQLTEQRVSACLT